MELKAILWAYALQHKDTGKFISAPAGPNTADKEQAKLFADSERAGRWARENLFTHRFYRPVPVTVREVAP